MKRVLSFLLVSFFAFITSNAFATHGTAEFVDAIDGSGPGVFVGSIGGSGLSTAAWYSFSAAPGASVSIETTAANFDTTLTLYSVPGVPMAGDDRDDYTQLAYNDDGGFGSLSLINFGPLAGGNYIVAVEQFGGGGGNFTLSISGTGISAVSEVPEPASGLLWLSGCLGFVAIRRYRKSRKCSVRA